MPAPREPAAFTWRRRAFVVSALSTFGWRAAVAQAPVERARIGYLFSSPLSVVAPLVSSFESALAARGRVLGQDTRIAYRFGPASAEALRRSARELSDENDVLVVSGTVVAAAARDAGVRRPVVFAPVGFPVASGFARSLRRPGGNFTGISFEAADDTYGKRLQMLKEVVPGLAKVAALGDAGDRNLEPSLETLHRVAPGLGIAVAEFTFKSEDDMAPLFADMQSRRMQGVVVIAGALAYRSGPLLAELAIRHRMPSVHGFRETVASGGLLSLGPDLVAISAQAARYVDLILRGSDPAQMPIEQPSRYEVGVNVKTAGRLGLSIPPSMLSRADFIVE